MLSYFELFVFYYIEKVVDYIDDILTNKPQIAGVEVIETLYWAYIFEIKHTWPPHLELPD